jgi:hypothetical protein
MRHFLRLHRREEQVRRVGIAHRSSAFGRILALVGNAHPTLADRFVCPFCRTMIHARSGSPQLHRVALLAVMIVMLAPTSPAFGQASQSRSGLGLTNVEFDPPPARDVAQ